MLRKGLSLEISYPGPQGLGRLPREKVVLVVGSPHTARPQSADRGAHSRLVLLGSPEPVLPAWNKCFLLEQSISDASVQDRDTKVSAEVEGRDWKLRRVGSKGGQASQGGP